AAQRCWAGQLGRRRLAALLGGQAVLVLAVWSVNHALLPAEMTADCLWDLACTWGGAYACFLLLLSLRNRPFPGTACWLGRVSYSVYLLHPFVLTVLGESRWPAGVAMPGEVAGTLLLAGLAFRFVEAPGIAAGRALERRWLSAVARPVAIPIPH